MPAVKVLVHETSTSTGTGNITLANLNGKQSFNTAFGTGGSDVFDYFVSNRAAGEWEYGTGHLSDATTLVRDTVVESSNSNNAVDFSAGTKDVTNAPYLQDPILDKAAPGEIGGTTPAAASFLGVTARSITPEADSLYSLGTTSVRYSKGWFDGITIGAGNINVDNVLDQDDMSSDSATALATQQSIKAYTDTYGRITSAGTTDTSTGASSYTLASSIPTGVRRIVVIFDEVSLSGTDDFLVQIGDSGGVETTGYTSDATFVVDNTNASTLSSVAGYLVIASSAGGSFTGRMMIDNTTGNKWVESGNFTRDGVLMQMVSGRKTLSATLDRVVLDTSGSDTFDAGEVTVLYEY